MLCAAALLLLAGPGCVRRTLTIRTAPEGSRVVLNDEEIGVAPVSVDFTWYGDYDVILRKEGYETLKTNHKLDAPWYQIPPIDLIAEAFVPWTIHDRREVSFTLEPRQEPDRDQLIRGAKELRDRALYGQ
jgi:hypothetical protein